MLTTSLIQSSIQRYSPMYGQESFKPKKKSEWEDFKEKRIQEINEQPLLNQWCKEAYLAREPFPAVRFRTVSRKELNDLLFGTDIEKFAKFLRKRVNTLELLGFAKGFFDTELSSEQVQLQQISDDEFVFCELSYEFWFDEHFTRHNGLRLLFIELFPEYGNEIYEHAAKKIAVWENRSHVEYITD